MSGINREEYADMSIENLNQLLEDLDKDNETIRRENKLFRSYIQRNGKDAPLLEEEETRETEKRNKKKQAKVVHAVRNLTAEEKYEIANAELEELKKNIQEGEMKSETLLETLKAYLDEIDITIAEIKREAHEFKRDIVLGSENSRTGKIVAERLVKYIEEKLKQKDALIEKFRMQNEQLAKNIKKEKQKMERKKQASDDLQFIDFHQLQIENKKLVKDIDERNKQLLSLKVTAGKTIHRLTSVKTKLIDEENDVEQLKKEINESKVLIQQNEEEIKELRKKIKKANKVRKRYTQKKDKLDDLPSVGDYIDLKSDQTKLISQLHTLERKITIATPHYERALTLLKNNNQEV